MSISRSQAERRVAQEGGLSSVEWMESYHVMSLNRWSYTKLKAMIKEHGFPRRKNGHTNIFWRPEVEAWNQFFFGRI
jgi:hypothetical protein